MQLASSSVGIHLVCPAPCWGRVLRPSQLGMSCWSQPRPLAKQCAAGWHLLPWGLHRGRGSMNTVLGRESCGEASFVAVKCLYPCGLFPSSCTHILGRFCRGS